jgi:hypothetical protein
MVAAGRQFAIVAVLLGLAAALPAQEAREFYCDFRKQPLPAQMTEFNSEEGKFYHFEPEGLRITLPSTWIHPWGGVGFRTFVSIPGDFDVTAGIEILHADWPKGGYGVGVCLYAAQTGGAGASVCRLVRARGERLLWDVSGLVPGPKIAREAEEGTEPCMDKVGRLRLQRTGSTMRYLWSQELTGDNFAEFHQCEFSTATIDRIRLAVLTGRQPCDVSVRLIDLRLRWSEGVAAAAAEAAAAPAPTTRRGLWWGLALLGLLSLALGLALHRGRRRGPAGAARA